MDDIAARLMKWAGTCEMLAEGNEHRVEAMMYREAADEIVALRELLTRSLCYLPTDAMKQNLIGDEVVAALKPRK